ncbi:PTS 2-O-a-mannosyl-D-glycerate transporter subunit IIABC, partial [Escherichia coli]
LIEQALALEPLQSQRVSQPQTEVKKGLKTDLKQALLSGISFAVPLIVAGGTVLAVAVLIAQIFGLQDVYSLEKSWLWMYR